VKSAGRAGIRGCVHSLIGMEQSLMQQSVPKSFPYVASETTSRPCRHVRVLRRIDHALDQLDWLAKRCLKAFGQAHLDGLIAYGTAMHGLPYPIAAPPADAPIWIDPYGDMAEAHSRDMINGCGKSPFQYEPEQTGGIERAPGRPPVVAAADTGGHAALGRNADET
jgi:hypothetical protein